MPRVRRQDGRRLLRSFAQQGNVLLGSAARRERRRSSRPLLSQQRVVAPFRCTVRDRSSGACVITALVFPTHFNGLKLNLGAAEVAAILARNALLLGSACDPRLAHRRTMSTQAGTTIQHYPARLRATQAARQARPARPAAPSPSWCLQSPHPPSSSSISCTRSPALRRLSARRRASSRESSSST